MYNTPGGGDSPYFLTGGGGGGGGSADILGFEIMTIQIFLGCVFTWIKIDSLGFDILDT